MEQLKLKLASPEEAKEVGEWLKLTPEFDAGILTYPTFRVITSYGSKGNIAHLPSQQVLMLESVAARPEADDSEKAQALRDLVKASELLASSFNLKEIYFLATDENVSKMAQSHGFELLPWQVCRMRLA
jgi:hypothetical protein